MELRIYASIGRAIARRPAVPRDGAGFAYHAPILTVLIIFIVLSAVEIPILDLIVHRWPVVRISMLVLGIWGLTWMIGLLCAMLMRPHTVGPEGIRVREGLELDIPLSWDDIASVELARRVDEQKRRGSPRTTGFPPSPCGSRTRRTSSSPSRDPRRSRCPESARRAGRTRSSACGCGPTTRGGSSAKSRVTSERPLSSARYRPPRSLR
ncbi:hypothetical protein [Microbacterium stercoris]|uniref:Uncharacterized protein n=1 Tax=Microbacterium stercoris TaxID=2820289 RepID=A0A939QHM4_9MICO|nr:hypothetical protein [Microbacterium stercoris]MBO3662210.1 hypothetical protein [Microbacterium stercoris]